MAAADADNDNKEDARNGMRVLLQLSVYALTYTDNYTTTLYAFCYLVPARYVLVAYFSFFVCLAEALRDMVTAIVVKFSEYVDGQNPDHYRGGSREGLLTPSIANVEKARWATFCERLRRLTSFV